MADDEERLHSAAFPDQFGEGFGTGIVDPVVRCGVWRFGERRGDERPRFLRPRCGGYKNQIGNEVVADNVVADDRCVGTTSLGEFAVAVAFTGFGAFVLA